MNLHDNFIKSLPQDRHLTPDKWVEKNVVPSQSKIYSFDQTPFTRQILQSMCNHTVRSVVVLAGPQVCKSALAQAYSSYLIANGLSGNMALFFESDTKANQEWKTRIYPQFQNCKPVNAILPMGDRRNDNIGQIILGSNTIFAFGANNPVNRTSKTLKYILGDEVHSWDAGALSEIKNRVAAVRMHKIVLISTCSNKGDQLHQEWMASTQRQYQWQCPNCDKWHSPEFAKNEQGRGGLIYDLKNNLKDGNINMAGMRQTLRYQFPCCLFEMRDDKALRQRLNLNGRWSEPVEGSDLKNEGFRIGSPCAINYDWADIVKTKNIAILSLKDGDKKQLEEFVKQKECTFWENDLNKYIKPKALRLAEGVKKGPKGLDGEQYRCCTIDYQGGNAGEGKHFWVCVMSFRVGACLTMYEGKVWSEEEVVKIQNEYGISSYDVAIDLQYDTPYIKSLLVKYGWVGMRAGKISYWDIVVGEFKYKKFYSMPTDVFETIDGAAQVFSQIEYNNSDMKDRLDFMRNSDTYDFQVPVDISDQWKHHFSCEEKILKRNASTGEQYYIWHQRNDRNDLWICACWCVIMWDFFSTVIKPDLERYAPSNYQIKNKTVDGELIAMDKLTG